MRHKQMSSIEKLRKKRRHRKKMGKGKKVVSRFKSKQRKRLAQ